MALQNAIETDDGEATDKNRNVDSNNQNNRVVFILVIAIFKGSLNLLCIFLFFKLTLFDFIRL